MLDEWIEKVMMLRQEYPIPEAVFVTKAEHDELTVVPEPKGFSWDAVQMSVFGLPVMIVDPTDQRLIEQRELFSTKSGTPITVLVEDNTWEKIYLTYSEGQFTYIHKDKFAFNTDWFDNERTII